MKIRNGFVSNSSSSSFVIASDDELSLKENPFNFFVKDFKKAEQQYVFDHFKKNNIKELIEFFITHLHKKIRYPFEHKIIELNNLIICNNNYIDEEHNKLNNFLKKERMFYLILAKSQIRKWISEAIYTNKISDVKFYFATFSDDTEYDGKLERHFQNLSYYSKNIKCNINH